MKKKTPLYKKAWVWVVSAIVIIVIPLGINYAYLKGLDLQAPNTAFSASDWLSFYGTLLGALTTVVALIVTIRFTAHQNIQELRNQKRTLIAEYKKTELLKAHEEMKQYALKIKKLYLLDVPNENTTATGLERLFLQSEASLFVKDIGELDYWIGKLELSNSTIENEFTLLINGFIDNSKKLAAGATKRDNERKSYRQEYEKEKREFEERKSSYLKDNIGYKIQLSANLSRGDKSSPAYGEFKMVEPEKESAIMFDLSKDLKKYRDAHKASFIAAFDAFLAYKQELLEKAVSALYEFIDTEN